MADFYLLQAEHTDPARLKRERERARALRQSAWGHRLLQKGLCHYCEKRFSAKELTLDHIVPLARGGSSQPGNLVAACRPCNQAKGLETPVDSLFRALEAERQSREEVPSEKSSGGSPGFLGDERKF
jgi:5-methylcytosine-specific restriction endonuclease McrA